MTLSANVRPFRPHRQQQPARHSHRAVGQQIKLQLRGRRAQLFQQIRRKTQQLRCQQPAYRRGQGAIQRTGGRHQHRLSGQRVAKAVSAVQQNAHADAAAVEPHGCRSQLAADSMAGRSAENDRQHQICRCGRQKQGLSIHICIKNAVCHGHSASGKQSKTQHTPRHGAGNRRQQQGKARQLFLSAEGRQRQQQPVCQLYRRGRQKRKTRQKYRHRVSAPKERPQKIPPPLQRDSGQPGRAQQQQIIHQSIEQKYAVHIHHCHGKPPLCQRDYYRAGWLEKPSQKERPAHRRR